MPTKRDAELAAIVSEADALAQTVRLLGQRAEDAYAGVVSELDSAWPYLTEYAARDATGALVKMAAHCRSALRDHAEALAAAPDLPDPR